MIFAICIKIAISVYHFFCMNGRKIWAIGCFFWSAQFVQAQTETAASSSRRAIPNHTEIGTAAPFELRIESRTPAAASVQWKSWGERLDTFEIVEKTPVETRDSGDWVIESQTLTLMAWDSGYHVIKPLILATAQGDTLRSKALLIQVAPPPQVDINQAPRPLAPPLAVERDWWGLLKNFIRSYGLYILLFAAALWWFFRRKNRTPKPLAPVSAPPAPVYTPKENALSALKKLSRQQLWQKGEVEQHYIQLSDIVRTYIETRFELPALESTTAEIIQSVKRHTTIEPLAAERLRKMLLLADMVKFAQTQPDLSDNERSIQDIERWIKAADIRQRK